MSETSAWPDLLAYIDDQLERRYRDAAVAWSAQWLYGSGTGTTTGILALADEWESPPPTPMERALAVLAPQLAACPLYRAGTGNG